MSQGILPVCIFTKNRTGCACATVGSVLENLSCSGRNIRWILCDDQSVPGHVEAVLQVFRRHGVKPSVHRTTEARHGLGASMNMGLEDAFSNADKCLRMEDDWLLKRPLDLGPWVAKMDRLGIGSLRLGMMFRKRHELKPFPGPDGDLLRVCSAYRQLFTFNNQLALVTREMHGLIGAYPENAPPPAVEKHGGNVYNRATEFGARPPYVAWPATWETQVYYGDNMAFAHIGVSISGHKSMYWIPERYRGYNVPARDEELRRDALQEAVGGKVGIL